ncbi:alpha/beta hydrolase [Pedobacter rhizosphaerae]|uniref:Acetyl esterase/lipase n=1 Tax=Pedobacter rhizosphaerae TaxID=390241 RepID=A0A1H9PRM5_9SPHI|nr:alpha/beta hydrolase [Pedobacter rhizosphaerae]SER50223.1 Acetyl esterase/lipase [Pedobacter rhizosphaerae]
MNILKTFALPLIFVAGIVRAQEFMPLYPNGKIPNSKDTKRRDSISNERVYRVANPGMYCFFPSRQENKGAAVIICPGGGYERLAYVISGTQLAKWFNTMGVSAFVLNYRLPNDPDLIDRAKGPLQDAQRAIKLVRRNAVNWGIKPNKIGIQGSSAGGHLASWTATVVSDISKIRDNLDTVSAKPDFMILVSPVIDMGKYAHKGSRTNLLGENVSLAVGISHSTQLMVNKETPPCFIADAFNDEAVDPHNSLLFYQALLENKIPSALHIFPQGGHAIALRNNPGSTELWTTLCEKWMLEMDIIPFSLK